MTREQYEAKKYLSRAKEIHQKIDLKLMLIEKLEARLIEIKTQFGKNRIQGGKNKAEKVGDNLAIFIDEKDKLLNQIKLLYKKIDEIESVIENATHGNTKTALLLRYTNFLSFNDIASNMNYSCRYVKKLNAKGLSEVSKFLNEKA